MSAVVKAHPDKFFIGIDANAKPLEKLSTRITRKPAKGGLPNAMFVKAAVEDLPIEFDGIASEIYINFPWGSLLRAVATGGAIILDSLRRISTPEGRLTITIGIDPTRDRGELGRLGIPELNKAYIENDLNKAFAEASFLMTEHLDLEPAEWSRLDTSWARKLGGNENRQVFRLSFVRK